MKLSVKKKMLLSMYLSELKYGGSKLAHLLLLTCWMESHYPAISVAFLLEMLFKGLDYLLP
jgi:hypothetical protein